MPDPNRRWTNAEALIGRTRYLLIRQAAKALAAQAPANEPRPIPPRKPAQAAPSADLPPPPPPKPPVPPMPALSEDDLLDLYIFHNTSPWEKFEGRVYHDKYGVPTIGFGYALAIENKNNHRWYARSDEELHGVGITLTPADRQRLDTTVRNLNAGQPSPDKVPDPYGLALTRDEAKSVFDLSLPYFKGVAERALQDSYYLLSPEQQAAVVDFAYLRPAWIADSAAALRAEIEQAAQTGDWEAAGNVLEAVAAGADEPIRRRAYYSAELFRKPLAPNVYQVQPGESVDSVLNLTGNDWSTLKAQNPWLQNRSKPEVFSGERLYFTLPKRGRGRVP